MAVDQSQNRDTFVVNDFRSQVQPVRKLKEPLPRLTVNRCRKTLRRIFARSIVTTWGEANVRDVRA